MPLRDATGVECAESFVSTKASMLSESSEAAVMAALLLALTSEPLSSIRISADIIGLLIDLIQRKILQQN
jgi:hypothetical protein